MLRCVIVDDEEYSIEAIKVYIDQIPELIIIGTYTNPRDALKELYHSAPFDILFLDVDMPIISGIELAKVLRGKSTKLIFTTSHSKYAFDAFEVEADAFLLKPFSFAKFSLTVAKLFPEKETSTNASDYFLVKNKDEDLRIVKVKYDDVIAFESFQNYVKIHLTNNKSITVYLSIKDILELVKGRNNFRQFHRAYVISTELINYIEGGSIRMSNNLVFNIGERYKEEFSAYVSKNLVTTARKK